MVADGLALEVPLEGSGVGESFEEVFRRVLPRAIRVAHRILGDDGHAEDAAAEALARAHASWARIGRSGYADAWILRVTANVAVDIHRRSRRHLAHGLRFLRAEHASDETERSVGDLALASALAGLPRRQREVVVLRYLEDLSETDVAAALGLSLGTVKTNAFRAREALRKRLGADLEAD